MKISVVVVTYNMRREAPRTLLSLATPYQRRIAGDQVPQNRLQPPALGRPQHRVHVVFRDPGPGKGQQLFEQRLAVPHGPAGPAGQQPQRPVIRLNPPPLDNEP